MLKLPLQCLLLSATVFSSAIFAQTIYKTIDENGVVSFSDARPEGNLPVETLQITLAEPQANDSDGALDEARMIALRVSTDRMIADRMARESHRAELRKIRAQTAALEAQSPYDSYLQPPPSYTLAYPTPLLHRGVLRKRHNSSGNISFGRQRFLGGPLGVRRMNTTRYNRYLQNRN